MRSAGIDSSWFLVTGSVSRNAKDLRNGSDVGSLTLNWITAALFCVQAAYVGRQREKKH